MKDTLGIGSAVREILISSSVLSDATGGSISPLVAEENTTYPFVTYGILEIRPRTTKDGHFAYGDVAEVGITVFADSYEECVELSIEIRRVMVSFSGQTEDYDISSVSFSGASDDYSDGAFYRNMVFTIEID